MNHNKVHLGDCREVMKSIPDSSIDLTVTSPPYDNLRSYDGVLWSFDIFKEVAQELYRITKQGGVVVWVVGDSVVNGSETGTSFKQALYFLDCGFKLNDTMIFEKNTTAYPARRDGVRYSQIFEYMFIFSKGKIKTANLICDKPNKYGNIGHIGLGKNTNRQQDGTLKVVKNIKPVPAFSPRNNIWRYQVNYGYSTKYKDAHKHPAIFPEALAKDHITSWSNEGDIIFDPFAGSGTTLVSALNLNRRYIGVEVNKDYYGLIIERLALST